MTQIVGCAEGHWSQGDRLPFGIDSEVLQVVGLGAQRTVGTTQTLEKVVRRTVLLNDDHDVLKTRDLGLDGHCTQANRKPQTCDENSDSDFHGDTRYAFVFRDEVEKEFYCVTAVPGPARMLLHPTTGELNPTIPRKRPVCQEGVEGLLGGNHSLFSAKS